ncbi:CLC_0170 family protein [Thermosediminibacter litoriperuensis]|uniref:Uncharacterized protein n=1 Tax=Thermosediminibacter litoriperuensis TaxID=291989 RepID=A0A5S5AIG6_9FIRM|nr:CLC_0170 family protein [Thermosediminibacter litoriperuensis]TYP49231.1 hypothetical protein LZ11_02198 [Thermosediminibacter litoriperuensis]
MQILTAVLEHVKDALTPTTAIVFIVSGLFLIFLDSSSMAEKNLRTEAVLVKAAGILYIIGSLALFIFTK